jgi:hypothetical protein
MTSTRGRLPAAELERATANLKPFQQSTVATVVDAMFERDQRRFLVADEVGLGKTKVARSLVAETIRRLWDDTSVDRIDIVYICSNQQIARQNVQDLMVLPGAAKNLVDRLTMLPSALNDLGAVNVVSFTPGTSLTFGHAGGKASERAMLFRILSHPAGVPRVMKQKWARDLFGLGTKSFVDWEHYLRSVPVPADFVGAFVEQLDEDGLLARIEQLTDGRRARDPDGFRPLIGELRRALARCCIGFLTPDLIILDEFQKFTDVLDGRGEDGELARLLLQDSNARVLLLSATPYRMLTNAADDESHFEGFERTVRFLLGSEREDDLAKLRRGLGELRSGLLERQDADQLAQASSAVKSVLRSVMVRTERLAATENRGGMLDTASSRAVCDVTTRDVRSFVDVDRVAAALHGVPSMVEYWKSAPYLLNFMDDYVVKREIKARLAESDESFAKLLRGRHPLTQKSLQDYGRIDPLNGRLRWLLNDLDQSQSFDVLWVPPAMPQVSLSGPYERARDSGMTKRLVFSGWSVVPKAVAALTSFEFERRHHRPGAKYKEAHKFSGRLVADRPSTLALHLPCDFLAEIGDPMTIAKALKCAMPVDRSTAEGHVAEQISARLAPLLEVADHSGPQQPFWYLAALAHLDPSILDLQVFDFVGEKAKSTELSRLLVDLRERAGAPESWGRPPDDLAVILAQMALAGPGSVVLRGLRRLDRRHAWEVEPPEVHQQAAGLAWSFRSVFNSPEADSLIGSDSGPDGDDYWRQVLTHCGDGGLGAVVDEWFDLLLDQQRIVGSAGRDRDIAALESVTTHASKVLRLADGRAFADQFGGKAVAELPRNSLRTHFAMRYGQARGDSADGENPTDVRNAFNSPFRPFVLISTSVGQEGLDFHYYAHSIVHWNLPGNPVDLEQREGRVHRYKNHAVRKNVAECVMGDSSFDPGDDPWKAAFAHVGESNGGLSPWWIFPGTAAIQRLVPMLPLSREQGQLDRLVEATSLYRMTLGQPRQSELLEVLGEMDEADQERMREAIAVNLAP